MWILVSGFGRPPETQVAYGPFNSEASAWAWFYQTCEQDRSFSQYGVVYELSAVGE